MSPNDVNVLSLAELVDFVEANRKRQLDDWKMLAQVGYSAGIVGSMSLSKTRPKFEDMFNFPQEEKKIEEDTEVHKVRMIAWAQQMNAIDKAR